MPLGARHPLVGVGRRLRVDEVPEPAVLRVGHHGLDVAARAQDELRPTGDQLGGPVAGLPWRDVVGHPGRHVRVAADAGKVDRRAEDLQGTRVHELVGGHHVQHLVMEAASQPGRVRVPGEDVEGRRVLTEQVVVHPVVPHQVVGAQPGKHRRHLPAVDHSGGERHLLGDREGLRGPEEEHPPVRLAVEQGDEHRRGVNLVLPQGGEVRLRDRGRHPAQAAAHDVHIRRTGDLAGNVERLDRRLRIGVEIPVALRPRRVAPAYPEHADAALEQVFVQAAAW